MKRKWLAVGIILLFVAIAFSPTCTAKVAMPLLYDNRSSQVLSTKKVTQANNDEKDFFHYAIVYGTFEEKWITSLFFDVLVFNRDPWENRTLTVIGYVVQDHQWYVKHAFWVACNAFHIGFIGRNRLFVIGILDVTAF